MIIRGKAAKDASLLTLNIVLLAEKETRRGEYEGARGKKKKGKEERKEREERREENTSRHPARVIVLSDILYAIVISHP